MINTQEMESSLQLCSPMIYNAMKMLTSLPDWEDREARFEALDEADSVLSDAVQTIQSISKDLNDEMMALEDEIIAQGDQTQWH